MKLQKTAILIFAQSAQKEAANKPFKNAAKVFTQLNKHTINTVKKTKLPYFHATENTQTGITFGERLTNAIQSVYDQGFDNVITIGNDTPHLRASHIIDTAKKLESHRLILGPSKDGGFYLIGLHKSQFNPATFLQLPWQTKTLTKELLVTGFQEKKQVHILATLEDIDNLQDIKTVVKKFRILNNRTLQQLLETLVSNTTTIEIIKISFKNFLFQDLHFNKGSPSLHFA